MATANAAVEGPGVFWGIDMADDDQFSELVEIKRDWHTPFFMGMLAGALLAFCVSSYTLMKAYHIFRDEAKSVEKHFLNAMDKHTDELVTAIKESGKPKTKEH